MGGTVGLTIREPNGKEHRMARWTNILPWAIKNIRLLNKDEKHLQDVLKLWYEMRDDYLKHEKDKKFEFNMTECYAPHPYLAPIDYGLVVVDMVNNEILDYQGYTSPDTIDKSKIKNDMLSNETGAVTLLHISPENERSKELGKNAFYLDNDELDAVRFRELFVAGKITTAIDMDDESKTIDLRGKNLDDIINLVKRGKSFLTFPVDMSPYKLTKYEEHDADEALRMIIRIKELGFTLSDKEKLLWNEWIEDHQE